jgi:hypothetical protein
MLQDKIQACLLQKVSKDFPGVMTSTKTFFIPNQGAVLFTQGNILSKLYCFPFTVLLEISAASNFQLETLFKRLLTRERMEHDFSFGQR